MLYLDAPIGPINGLMIYRDHADASLFYYIPERPRLAMNEGVPEFVFMKYRRDITDNADFDPDTKQSLGGGFLAFTVDLGVSDDLIDDTKGKLGRFADGDVKLTPVQFRKGSVRLSMVSDAADGEGDAPPAEDTPRGFKFFEKVMGASHPSLFGFNRATFAVVLGQEAATLMEAGLRSGISPIGVIYDLEFLGMRPAFNVKITAEYKRIYDHLEVQFGARGQIGPVSLGIDIGAAFQKLRDDGAVKVEVQNFTDDDDFKKQADDAFNWFKQELLRDFFKSALEPPSFMRQGQTGGMLAQFQNMFQGLNQTQPVNSLTPQYTQPAAPLAAPQGTTPAAAGGNAAAPPTALDSGTRSLAQVNQQNSQAMGGGPAGGQGAAGGANPSPFQVAFSLKYYRQEELKTRTFEYAMQAAVPQPCGPQGMFSTLVHGLDLHRCIIEVDLDDDFFKRLVTTVTIGGDLTAAGVGALTINYEYPAVRKPGVEAVLIDGHTFRPDPEGSAPKTFTCWLDAKKSMTYRYRTDIHFSATAPWVAKETHVASEWKTASARQLSLDPLDDVGLFPVDVTVGALDPNSVSQVQVELSYEDAANDFRAAKTFVLRSTDAPQRWPLRLSDRTLQRYRYRKTFFLADGLRHQTDWVETDNPTLVINEPYNNKIRFRLVPMIDATELLECVVDLEYVEADTGFSRRLQQVYSPTDLAGREVTIPTLSATPGDVFSTVTLVRADGSVFNGERTQMVGRVIVVGDGGGRLYRLQARLAASNLAALGLVAVKVDFQTQEDGGDSDSALFTASATGEQLVSLSAKTNEPTLRFRYRVTGYTDQGRVVPGEAGEGSGVLFVVPLPQP